MAPSARLLAAAALLLCHQVAGQNEELGPNYIGEEGKPPLPETALLNGKVVELDELGDIIYLNRSSANLNCGEGKMQIDVNFKEPFNGIIYANFDRTSPCTWHGDGKTSYHVELPLRGCGTKQGPARVFTNNIIMRFHPHLEWAGDEVVTIVCRYPPPIAAPPVAGLPRIAGPPESALTPLKKIGEADIILIICAILFLALLMLGLGFGYACLKKRRISLIKEVPLDAAPESEGSQGSVMPIFPSILLPRIVSTGNDATGSETLPSDYPSESPSTGGSGIVDDGQISAPPTPAPPLQMAIPPGAPPMGVPNHSYVMTEEAQKTTLTNRSIREEVDIHRQPNLMKKLPDAEALYAAEQQLMTTLNTAESETFEPPAQAHVRHVQAELHTPPRSALPPTISSEFRVLQPPLPPPPPSEPDTVASQDLMDRVDFETLESAPLPPPPPPHKPVLTTQTVDDRILSTITETKVYEDIERRRRAVKEYYERKQQALPPDWDIEIRQYPPAERDFPDTASSHWDDSSVGTEVPPLPGLHAARTAFESTDHFTSTDQTLLTSTTTRTGVDVTRSATAIAVPPLPPAPQPPSPPAIGRLERPSDGHDGPEEPIRPMRREITPPRRNPPSMDVLIRVLEAPQEFDDRLSVLTDDDRETLRQLITREETFRTMLAEARVYQDFERIRQDERFARILSAQKWDVIIRVLAPPPLEVTPSEFSETTRAPSEITDFSDIPEPPPEPRIHRYRKTSNQLQQLPPVYEYETGPGRPPRSGPGSTRSHVTTRSSYGGDVRSMTEEMVSFHRYQPDEWSESDAAPRPLSIDPADGGPLAAGAQRTYFESHQQVELPGGGQRRYFESHQEVSARGAPSTIGDREEVYSMAETDVDWQRR